AIAAGGHHGLAIKTANTVQAWGDNSNGQTDVPEGLTDVIAISAGYEHSLALRSDGTVVAWGANYEGQTDVPEGLTGVMEISAVYDYSMAIKSDGTVVAWGDMTVPEGLTDVVAVSGSMAMQSNGTIVDWGSNYGGHNDVPEGLVGLVPDPIDTWCSGCTDVTACNYEPDAFVDDGGCEYVVDCAGECGGSSVEDECGVCNGSGPSYDCGYYGGDLVCSVDDCPPRLQVQLVWDHPTNDMDLHLINLMESPPPPGIC
ncbi:uncharacterized protein METZ01_LOCUS448906, partial [marine metagenome]